MVNRWYKFQSIWIMIGSIGTILLVAVGYGQLDTMNEQVRLVRIQIQNLTETIENRTLFYLNETGLLPISPPPGLSDSLLLVSNKYYDACELVEKKCFNLTRGSFIVVPEDEFIYTCWKIVNFDEFKGNSSLVLRKTEEGGCEYKLIGDCIKWGFEINLTNCKFGW